MKENRTTKESDLEVAKAFLNSMLAPLNKDERKELLKRLIDLTEKI